MKTKTLKPTRSIIRPLSKILLLITIAISALPSLAVTIDSISPPTQRVYDFIVIRGNDFGTSQGSSRVQFTSGGVTIDAGTAYVWRDNYIRIRVPTGNRIAGINVLIPKTPLLIQVQNGDLSNSLPFQVINDTASTLEFREMTSIDAGHLDENFVLGSPVMNAARTKDAELGDVNQDGFMDIIDNNSQNELNNSHSVLRINNQDKTFTSVAFEPLSAGDAGTFAANITAGHEYFGDGVSYDADLADVNNDGFPDYLHTASMGGGTNRVRLYLNNASSPVSFTEVTNTWLADGIFIDGQFPDDLAHIDINNDGFVDFAVTLRKRNELVDASITKVFLNDNGSGFHPPLEISAPSGISTHDVFFIDANNDGRQDIVLCNETGGADTQLYINNGNVSTPFNGVTPVDFDFSSETGATADLNGDGFEDFVLSKSSTRVFFNNPAAPGTFTALDLPFAGGTAYDIELGDIDLDGDVDIIAAIITSSANDAVKIWLNDGDSTFTHWTSGGATTRLPGLGGYQRLSADLLDLDNDGDLDLYLSGADAQSVGLGGNGKVPNQLFENTQKGFDIVTPIQTQSAFGGTALLGQKIMVRIRSNLPIVSVSPADFETSINSVVSTVITATKIEEEYWLLLQAPPMTDGCYDLEVNLTSDTAIKDLEANSVCYGDSRAFSRALAIDRTNSMNRDSFTGDTTGEKMQSARAAAQIFVDLSTDADQIGVTSFKRDSDDGDGNVEQSELAQDDYGMVLATVGGVDQRPLINDDIELISPDGMNFGSETSIGAGLLQAFNMLASSATAGNEREIILLSDGRENYQPYWLRAGAPGPVAGTIIGAAPNVTVHTVALGQDANVEVLMDIAQQTGGSFHNLYEGNGSFFLLSRLANTFKFIDEVMRDEQRFFYKEDLPQKLGSIPVATGFDSISLAFHWNINDAVKDITLIDSNGDQVLVSADVTRYKDDKHIVYRIQNPKPGIWQYRVARTDVEMEFFAVASGISTLVIKKGPSVIKTINPGTFSIPIRVVLADHKPIPLASVTGVIIRPDKSKVVIVLRDDGLSHDGVAGDGVYGTIYTGNNVGGHQVDIKATGVSSLNEPFERRTMLGFAFPSADPDREGQGDAITDPNDELCVRCIYIAIFILFILFLWLWLTCCRKDRKIIG
ncbi:MAG: hypothetical protein ACI93R_000416 [Flavobacteriales bacterium]|jgi:hypothetical protein